MLLYSFKLSVGILILPCGTLTLENPNPNPGEPYPWRTLPLENNLPGETTLWLDVMKQISICNDKDTIKRWFNLILKAFACVCVCSFLRICVFVCVIINASLCVGIYMCLFWGVCVSVYLYVCVSVSVPV